MKIKRFNQNYLDLYSEFPTVPVTLEQMENEFDQEDLNTKPFIQVASEYIGDHDIPDKQRDDLFKFVNFTINKNISEDPFNVIKEKSPQKLSENFAAYNNPNFWNKVMCFIGISILSIILLSFYLSVVERPIPEFFGTSIGTLIGVLVSLFAGWSQLKK